MFTLCVWKNASGKKAFEKIIPRKVTLWKYVPKKNCFRKNAPRKIVLLDFWFCLLFFICFYHVTYAFQSVSTLCICLNAKELLAQNRRHIWSLSDCNGNRTQNHLVRKQTLNHLAKLASLAKWLSVRLRTNWLWIRVSLQSLKHLIVAHFPNFHSN